MMAIVFFKTIHEAIQAVENLLFRETIFKGKIKDSFAQIEITTKKTIKLLLVLLKKGQKIVLNKLYEFR